jgi:hypothetical protein
MQIDIITSYFNRLEELIGLPLWAIFTISIACLIIFYFYVIRIPIAVLKTRKELTNLRQLIGASIEETKRNYHKQGSYMWNR